MTRLEIKGSDDAIAALEAIALEMVRLFLVAPDEAYGRINRTFGWRSQGFYDDDGLLLLTHEDPYTWAMHVYYGKSSFWWLSEEADVEPLPYP